MGIIYQIIFPNGKSYVGQTTRTLDKRMNGHRNGAARNRRGGCRALYRAIRKYGWDSLEIKTLEIAENDKLDDLERHYIAELNTLVDNGHGYNLNSGGNNNYNYSIESRERMRQAQLRRDPRPFKKSDATRDLPIYMGYYKGYIRISGHPKCPWKAFKDPSKTDEENLADALAYYAGIESGEIVHQQKELPKGIQKLKKGYRVCVKCKKFQLIWDGSFTKQKHSEQYRLLQALEFMELAREERRLIKEYALEEEAIDLVMSAFDDASPACTEDEFANEFEDESADDSDDKSTNRRAVQRLDGGGGATETDDETDDDIGSLAANDDIDEFVERFVATLEI